MRKTTPSTEGITEQYVLELIKSEYPEWVEGDGSCKRCKIYYQHLDDVVGYDSVYE